MLHYYNVILTFKICYKSLQILLSNRNDDGNVCRNIKKMHLKIMVKNKKSNFNMEEAIHVQLYVVSVNKRREIHA